MFTALLLCSLGFAESRPLALQIALDRKGYSCNTIDGQWGAKSEDALRSYMARKGKEPALDTERFFRIETVTQADLDNVVAIPAKPADKAKLARMGYESIKEMFAERGHLSQIALERMNPGVDWDHIAVGTKLVIPNFPTIAEEFKAKRPPAAKVVISLSACLVRVYGKDGAILATYPCSIAANKAHVPECGELKMTNCVAWPNYTYTPDYTPPGKKVARHIWPAGENCPVGVAWMGLNLPGYGIHGTPRPESIGFTGSHGCFRLANWNAARLFSMCKPGTPVIIVP